MPKSRDLERVDLHQNDLGEEVGTALSGVLPNAKRCKKPKILNLPLNEELIDSMNSSTPHSESRLEFQNARC